MHSQESLQGRMKSKLRFYYVGGRGDVHLQYCRDQGVIQLDLFDLKV